MNKIKIYYLNTARSIFIGALLFLALFSYLIPAPRASAADQGCYQLIGTTTQGEVIRTYEEVGCPDVDTSIGAAEGRCYVAEVTANMSGQSTGSYNETDCDSFSVGQTTREKTDSTFEPSETDCEAEELTRDNCGIINYLVIAINFLSALAIMAIVASVMFAGYQYMTAGDNPGKVTAAKQRIIWALVALGLFVFGYALLNFLVPGGVL